MFERHSLSNIKKHFQKTLNMMYELEDLTNYDIQELGRAINILQAINIDEEYKKHNRG